MASGSGKSSSGGGKPGKASPPSMGERAIDAALGQGSSFRTRTMIASARASSRIVDHWAPEDGATSRQRSLGALAFADRLLSPYVGLADDSASATMSAYSSHVGNMRPLRVAPRTSWLFPVPWYVDEIEWIAAARASAPQLPESTQRAVQTAAPRRVVQASPAAIARAAAQFAPRRTAPARSPVSVPVALQYVAPSMARTAHRAMLASATPPALTATARHAPAPSAQTPLRAWSSLVPFPAAQAAEVMTRVLDVERDRNEWGEERPAPAPVMELVSPRELAPTPATSVERPHSLVPSVRARLERALKKPAAPARVEAPRPVAAPTMAVIEPPAPPAPAAPPPARVEAPTQAPAERRAPTPEPAPTSRPVTPPAAVAPPAVETPAAGTPAVEPPAVAPPAMETVAASDATPIAPHAIAADLVEKTPAIAQAEAAAPVPSHQVARALTATRATELLTRAALAGRSTLAPSAGPRVALPAGLGGLVTGVRAAHAVSQPLQRAIVRAPFVAAEPSLVAGAPPRLVPVRPKSAMSAVQRSRPAALTHVAWADRWLARFAGASHESLASLEAASRPSSGIVPEWERERMAPEQVYVGHTGFEPSRARPSYRVRVAPAAAPPRPAPPATPVRPVAPSAPAPATPAAFAKAPRIDDAAAVPDEMFEKIAAASVSSRTATVRAKERAVERRREAARVAAQAPTPSIADQLLRAPPVAPGPGVSPGLASSPVAPALSNVIPLPASPSFDVRTMASADIAAAFLAGFIEPVTVHAGPAGVGPVAVSGMRAVALPPGLSASDPRVLARLAAGAPAAAFLTSPYLAPEPERKSYFDDEGEARVDAPAPVWVDTATPGQETTEPAGTLPTAALGQEPASLPHATTPSLAPPTPPAAPAPEVSPVQIATPMVTRRTPLFISTPDVAAPMVAVAAVPMAPRAWPWPTSPSSRPWRRPWI